MEFSLDLPDDVRGGGKGRAGRNVSVDRSTIQVLLTHSRTRLLTPSLTHRRSSPLTSMAQVDPQPGYKRPGNWRSFCWGARGSSASECRDQEA